MRAIARGGGAAVQRDMVEAVGVTAGTVSKAVGELRRLDLIQDGTPGVAGRGRPTVPIEWSRRYASVGVRIVDRENLPAELVATVVDLAGNPVPGFELPRRRGLQRESQHEGKRLRDEMSGFVRKLATKARKDAGVEVLGCGVSMGGHVDHGVVRLSYNTGWGIREDAWSDHDEFDLRSQLEVATDLPVVLDNDVNALAVQMNLTQAEPQSFGVVAVLHDGVGAALVIGGDMWRGPRGLAGEIGHLNAGDIVHDERATTRHPPVCRCGEPGHIDAIASPRAIMARANGGDFGQLASRPPRDAVVAELFRQGGAALGRGIVSMINWVDPQRVFVLAPPELVVDDPSRCGSRYRDGLREELGRAFSTGRETPVELTPMSTTEIENRGAVSSAFLVLGRLIDKVGADRPVAGRL
ncbi:MAG: ROK family protein [Pseudonocardia sp.]